MGKRDRLRRVFRDLRRPFNASASESASNTSGTALGSYLKEPRNTTDGVSVTGSQHQNGPVRDLWGLALERFSEEEKVAMSQILSGSKLDILRHLRTAAEKRRNDCEDQRWKYQLNGRQIILRDVAEKIIVWIDKCKQIGDIAVNFGPVYASLPWAVMRFLLEVRLMITKHKSKTDG